MNMSTVQQQLVGAALSKASTEVVKQVRKHAKPRKPSMVEDIYHDPDKYEYTFNISFEDGEMIFSGRARKKAKDVPNSD